MICYMDRTFCVSPTCENKCQLRATEPLLDEAVDFGLPLSVAEFCDEDGEPTGLSGPGEFRKVNIKFITKWEER